MKSLTKNKKAYVAMTLVGLVAAFSHKQVAQAAQDTAQALQYVMQAISIAKKSDLDFGRAPQGSVAKTVLPGSADDASNASFDIAGEPNTAYSINLPGDSDVVMKINGGGSADKEIVVDQFASFPVKGIGTGLLGNDGKQLLLVGAQRAALASNQTTGQYSGDFVVEVLY